MPRNSLELAEEFKGHLSYLEFTRKKMERLYSRDRIVLRDIEQVYIGLFLECYTSFERLLDDLFIGIIAQSITHNAISVFPKIALCSYKATRDLVYSGRNFIDWLPYERNTEKRAKLFFKRGYPFTFLDNNDKQVLEILSFIRNAVAHKSKHSQKMFLNHVVGTTPVIPREKRVAGYLRSVFRITPRQIRYEYYIVELSSIARKLCA